MNAAPRPDITSNLVELLAAEFPLWRVTEPYPRKLHCPIYFDTYAGLKNKASACRRFVARGFGKTKLDCLADLAEDLAVKDAVFKMEM